MTSIFEFKIYNPYDAYLSDVGDNRFRYNQFNDKIKKLPESFQDFIFDAALANFIKDRISLPLELNQNQSKKIALIVMDLILTDLYLGNIVDSIKEKVNLDENKARTIAGLIVAELFGPILEDLKKMHVEKFARGQSRPAQSQSNQNFDDRVVDLKNII